TRDGEPSIGCSPTKRKRLAGSSSESTPVTPPNGAPSAAPSMGPTASVPCSAAEAAVTPTTPTSTRLATSSGPGWPSGSDPTKWRQPREPRDLFIHRSLSGFPGQSEDTLTDDVALDLARA